MKVFYFTSDLFVSVAATSMISLIENNRHFDSIEFYVVDDGISDEKKACLTQLIESYGRTITYIGAPEPSEIFRFPFKTRYQIGRAYPRMCIGTLLPQNVDRVLCLDSDTLVLGSLSELWNMDMQNNILAGVVDCLNLKAYRKQFWLDENELYCNAGVFLVDLKKWRDEKIEDKIVDVIQKNNGNIFFFEQTLMNYSCKGRVHKLPPTYNSYTLFYAFSYRNLIRWRKPTIFYTEDEVTKAKQTPVIIHFTRNFYMISRPWMENADHPKKDIYRYYKQMTPWKQLEADNRSEMRKLKYKIWHLFPQGLLATLVSIIYNNIRPKLWWKNE